MTQIFRGNLQSVRKQIGDELSALDTSKLDAADQFTTQAVNSNISPALASIGHDTTFYNSGVSTRTITLPNSGLSSHIGKRFHFTASATFSSALTVTSASTGLLRDKANGGAPHTVTNGTMTITVTSSAVGAYYSVGGDFA